MSPCVCLPWDGGAIGPTDEEKDVLKPQGVHDPCEGLLVTSGHSQMNVVKVKN